MKPIFYKNFKSPNGSGENITNAHSSSYMMPLKLLKTTVPEMLRLIIAEQVRLSIKRRSWHQTQGLLFEFNFKMAIVAGIMLSLHNFAQLEQFNQFAI